MPPSSKVPRRPGTIRGAARAPPSSQRRETSAQPSSSFNRCCCVWRLYLTIVSASLQCIRLYWLYSLAGMDQIFRCASVMSNPSFSLQGIISHKACIILAFDPGVPYSNKPKAKQSHVTEGGQTLTHVRQKNSDLPLLVASVAPEQALGTSPHFGGIEDIGGGKRLQVRCRLAWHCLVCKFWSISFFFAFCSTIWPLVTLQTQFTCVGQEQQALVVPGDAQKSRDWEQSQASPQQRHILTYPLLIFALSSPTCAK